MLETHRHDDQIVELRLARPPVNALDPELVKALDEAVQQATNDARALIISGREGLFSAGLDLPVLLELDRAGMRQFWQQFFGLLETVARSPVPVAAALTGHAPAGGAVLATFCDYRIMARGEFGVGLNETQVGLVVPPVIAKAFARLVGEYRAERLLIAGTMMDPQNALRAGFVDQLADPSEVVADAVAWLKQLLALPPHAMRATRRLVREPLTAMFEDPANMDLDAFTDGWFSDQTQATLKQVVAQLKAKK